MGSSSSKREEEERAKKEEEAKQKCIETKKNLEEKIEKFEKLAELKFQETKKLTEEAKKKLKEGDKKGAKRILVKKKNLEKQVETLYAQIQMMDDQQLTLENAINLGNIVATMKNATEVLNKNKITVEQFENEADMINENKNNINEIMGVMENYNNENEEELSDDIENIEEELAKEVKLPSANKESLKKSEKEDNLEDELNMLSV